MRAKQIDNVAANLDRRHDDTPRYPPPPEHQAEPKRLQLTKPTAPPARHLRSVFPRRDDQRRPDPVGLEYIDGARTVAFRATTAVKPVNMGLNVRFRNALGCLD